MVNEGQLPGSKIFQLKQLLVIHRSVYDILLPDNLFYHNFFII